MTEVWVVYGRTESGDDLWPMVFSFCPTVDQVEALLKVDYELEYEECDGVNWSIKKVIVISN